MSLRDDQSNAMIRAAAAFTLMVLTACGQDCGPSEVAAAFASAGPDVLECGKTHYGRFGCDTSAISAAARDCFAAAAKSCTSAHLHRGILSQDGPAEEDVFVVPAAAGSCKLHVVRHLTATYCPDPVLICEGITPTNPGECGRTEGLDCTGGYE